MADWDLSNDRQVDGRLSISRYKYGRRESPNGDLGLISHDEGYVNYQITGPIRPDLDHHVLRIRRLHV